MLKSYFKTPFSLLKRYTTAATANVIGGSSANAAHVTPNVIASGSQTIIQDAASRITQKPITSKKTFLLDYYKHVMDTHPLVLFAHYNNLNKNENNMIRALCKDNSSTLTVLRNSIFKVYLRNSQRTDPASPVKSEEKSLLIKNHPLNQYLKGPTCCIAFKELNPAALNNLFTVLKKHQDKLFVIGAKLDNESLDLEKILKIKDLPSKNVLQQQLLGVLHMLSGAGLVNTLEMASSKNLYLTLKSHEQELEKEGKESESKE